MDLSIQQPQLSRALPGTRAPKLSRAGLWGMAGQGGQGRALTMWSGQNRGWSGVWGCSHEEQRVQPWRVLEAPQGRKKMLGGPPGCAARQDGEKPKDTREGEIGLSAGQETGCWRGKKKRAGQGPQRPLSAIYTLPGDFGTPPKCWGDQNGGGKQGGWWEWEQRGQRSRGRADCRGGK